MIEVELKIDEYNNKKYYIKGTALLHREEGPAVESSNSGKIWMQNGIYHRLDGPAVEHADGTKLWYQNDKLHRLDGPAVDYTDSDKCWYLNGEEIDCQTQEQFEKSKEYRRWKFKSFW